MNSGRQEREANGTLAVTAWTVGLLLLLHGARWILGRVCFPNDLYIHYNWATFFFERLQAGCLKPEWLPELFRGLGGAVFAYYPPGYYAVTGLFRLVAGGIWPAMRLTEALGVGLLAAWAWAYGLRGRPGLSPGDRVLVLLAAAASPYLMAQLSLTGGLPSFFSGVLVLYLLVRTEWLLRQPGRRFDARLAVATGLIPWVHNLALPMALAAAGGGLILAWAAGRRNAGAAVLSMLTGTILGCGHLVTAALDTSAINMSNLVEVLDWRSGFALPLVSKVDWFVFQWVIGGLLAVSAAVLAVSWWQAGRGRRDPTLAYWLGALAVPLFFATELSWPLWAALPPLQHFQFPTRFFQPAGVAAAMGLACVVAGGGVPLSGRRLRWAGRLVLVLTAALSALLALKALRAGAPAAERIPSFADATCGQWEYLPANQPTEWSTLPAIRPGENVVLDGGTVAVRQPGPCGGLRAVVRRSEPGSQRLPLLAHPRWRVRVDDAPVDWIRDEAAGLIRIRLPAGESRIDCRWHRGPGQWLALAGLALLVVGIPALSRLIRGPLSRKRNDSGCRKEGHP